MTQLQQQTDSDKLGGRYQPVAVYFMDSDCVEYVKQDSFCVYDRVDNFLTLIYDETGLNLIGFKLKGFKYLFEKCLRPATEFLHDMQFVDLAFAIEAHVTRIGNRVFGKDEDRVRNAYKAAFKLAANDNVRLSGAYLQAAA